MFVQFSRCVASRQPWLNQTVKWESWFPCGLGYISSLVSLHQSVLVSIPVGVKTSLCFCRICQRLWSWHTTFTGVKRRLPVWCSRLHSWTELVFVQTDWDLACIPSWLCSLGEYSRRGNIPHIFACCRHYFKHNKSQKTTFSVSSLFVCRLAVWTCRDRSQSACKTLPLLLFQSTAGCKWWSFFWHVSSGNKWMSTFHHRGV